MAIDVFKRQGKSAVTGLLGKNLRRIAGNVAVSYTHLRAHET